MLGNFYGIGVNLFSQIVLVPFFISHWGIDLYGDWIALTAISGFFSMSDIGLNTVTANAYSIAYNGGNAKECDSLLANNVILILLMWGLVTIIGVAFVNVVNFQSFLSLRIVSSQTGAIVVFALACKIFIAMLSSVYVSIYRAKSLAYKTFFIGNSVRLLEAIVLLLGIILKVPMTWIVVFYCLPVIGQLLYYAIDTKIQYGYSIRLNAVDRKLFVKVLFPSLSFMSFPLGYAIILQGFTLVVNKFFGAESVVLYNTTRTICNFLKVIPNAVKNAIWPEFTIAFANKDIARMKKLYGTTLYISLSFIGIAAMVLLIGGDWIYEVWTGNAVQFSFSLMAIYMVTVFFNSIWEASGMTLMATNMHSQLGLLFVCLAVVSFFLANIVASVSSLVLIVLCVLFVDFILALYTLKVSRTIIQKASLS